MKVWVFIAGMFLVSFIPRVFPIFLLKDRPISPAAKRLMAYIPACIFSALVSADIFFWQGDFSLDLLTNIKLIPSIIVVLVSLKYRNLFVSMLVGVLSIALLNILL